MGCIGIAARVLDTDSSYKVKTLTSLIPRSKKWDNDEPQYLYEINMEKYKQHPELARSLISTGNATLYEATRDKRFGCGLPLSQARYIDHVAFDLIISMLGLNDLVFKLPNGHASPIFSDIGTAVDKVTDDMMFFKHQLQPYQTPIVLSHIVGLDLNRFNKFQTTFTDTQYAIDEAIPHINCTIISINDDDHLHTPMIQDSIHTLSGGRRFHKYHKLYDRLHPRHNTISTWADLIQKSAIINLNNLYVF